MPKAPLPKADMTFEERVALALERLIPDRLQYISVPNDGDFLMLPKGDTTIDLKVGKVTSPAGVISLSNTTDLLGAIQSGVLYADTPVTVEISPGYGKFPINPHFIVQGAARHMEKIIINSFYPGLFFAIFSTSPMTPIVNPVQFGQQRFTDSIISSVNYTDLKFVPRSVTMATLDQAKFGYPYFSPYFVSRKTFLLRNAGAVTVNLQIRGAMFLDQAIGFDQAGLTGWPLDPDIHVPGSAFATLIPLLPTQTIEIESSIPWINMKVQAALSAAGPNGRVVIEYLGDQGVR